MFKWLVDLTSSYLEDESTEGIAHSVITLNLIVISECPVR